MAERKSGPVKPPVIDLKARDASTPRTDAREDGADPGVAGAAGPVPPRPEPTPPPERPAQRAAPPPPPPPRPQARLAMPWSAISLAAIAGAVLGTMLTYGMVNLLPLPDKGPALPDPEPRLLALETGDTVLGERVSELEAQSRKTQVGLDATVGQLDAGLGELRSAIAALPPPNPQEPVDIAPLETQIKTLDDRLSAIGAGASSADAETLARAIAGIESSLADLTGRLAAAEEKASSADSRLAAVTAELTAAKAAIAAQNRTLGGAEVSPAVRLPLVLSGLESAFATGRAYGAELKSLTTLLPDLSVPAEISGKAASGLPRPDVVAGQFSGAIPEILAGRANVPSGDWGNDALEWAQGLLALRPVGEAEGNTPAAIVSRLEAAVDRRDFVAAADLLRSLPPAMRAGAGDIGTDIEALAAAETFIAGLRVQVLSPAPEAAQ